MALGANQKESGPSKRHSLIRGFDPTSLKSPPCKETLEKPELAEAASNLLEFSKILASELGSLKFMKELTSTVASAGEGLFDLTPPCPSVRKYMGSLRTVLSRSPKRFDPYFVEILSHNLRQYSAQIEGIARVASSLDVPPEAEKEVNISPFLFPTHILYSPYTSESRDVLPFASLDVEGKFLYFVVSNIFLMCSRCDFF